jgi:hypothetical protein
MARTQSNNRNSHDHFGPRQRLLHDLPIDYRSLWHISQSLTGFLWGLPLGLVLSVYTLYGQQPDGLPVSPWALGVIELVLVLGACRLLLVRRAPRPWIHTSWTTAFWSTGTLLLFPFLLWWRDFPESPILGWNMMGHWVLATCLITQLNSQVRLIGQMLDLRELQEEAKIFFRSVAVMFVFMWIFLGVVLAMATNILDGPRMAVATMAVMRIRGYLFFAGLIPLSLTLYLIWKARRGVIQALTEGYVE